MFFNMPTIFITSFHPLISRNILSTGLLEMLSKKFRIVLVVPLMKEAYFTERFGGTNSVVEGIDHRLSRKDIFLRNMFLACSATETMHVKRRSSLHTNLTKSNFVNGGLISYMTLYAWRAIASFLLGTILSYVGKSKILTNALRQIGNVLTGSSRVNELFDRHQPALLFSTDLQNEADVWCIASARRRGIQTIGMVRSWDNLSAKGIIRYVTDMVVVNNELIKHEAIRWNFVPAERIRVVGIPHYDRYVRGPAKSRPEFLKECSLDPNKKTILFAPIGERYMPNKTIDQEILGILAEHDVNIIVRMPPTDIAKIQVLQNAKAQIFFDDAGERSWKRGGSAPSRKASEIGDEDEERLINELLWSDCVVTGLSTIMIDGAVFDKPIVSVCFDKPEWNYWESFRRYHEYDHVKPVLQSGGVRIVYSPDELRTAVREYLVHPEKDSEGRKRIVGEQTFRFDGQSTKRLAAIIELMI